MLKRVSKVNSHIWIFVAFSNAIWSITIELTWRQKEDQQHGTHDSTKKTQNAQN